MPVAVEPAPAPKPDPAPAPVERAPVAVAVAELTARTVRARRAQLASPVPTTTDDQRRKR